MAKSKKNNQADIEMDLLDKELGLETMFGSDHGKILDKLPLFLPEIDKLLNGGLPFGRITEIAGKPGAGKTQLALRAARSATQLGIRVIFLDVEGTNSDERLRKLGIDTNLVKVINKKNTFKKNMTVERIGEIVEKITEKYHMTNPDSRFVFIWDSVGSTPSEVEVGKDFGDKEMGSRAAAIKQFLLKCREPMEKANALFIGVNQVRADVNGNSNYPTLNVPGGYQWEHDASLRLEVKNAGAAKITVKGKEQKIGHIARIVTKKSKISMPFQEADALMLSETGFDHEENLIWSAKQKKWAKEVNGGSKGTNYQYVDPETGETFKKPKKEFIMWMQTDEEGKRVRREMFEHLLEDSFPNYFSPLDNRVVDITQMEDTANLRKVYEGREADPDAFTEQAFSKEYTEEELQEIERQQQEEEEANA